MTKEITKVQYDVIKGGSENIEFSLIRVLKRENIEMDARKMLMILATKYPNLGK
jgi:hypothetical protein